MSDRIDIDPDDQSQLASELISLARSSGFDEKSDARRRHDRQYDQLKCGHLSIQEGQCGHQSTREEKAVGASLDAVSQACKTGMTADVTSFSTAIPACEKG